MSFCKATTTVYILSKLNTIISSSNRKDSEIDRKVLEINKLVNETCARFYHHEDGEDFINIEKMINRIIKFRDDRNYIMSIAFSATLFEEFAKLILLYKLKNETQVNEDDLTCDVVILALYTLKIIPESIYNKLFEVIEWVNDIIDKRRPLGFSSDYEARVMSDKAFDCALFLTKKYYKIINA